MNEELQSTNDEIRIINDQLGDSATDISRLNRKARELWGLSQDDVFEQPIFNLDIGLPVADGNHGAILTMDAERSAQQEPVRNEA
jgi:hypothetical protein